MTFDLFMVWSNLCPSCCSNTGRLAWYLQNMQVSELWPMASCLSDFVIKHDKLCMFHFKCTCILV